MPLETKGGFHVELRKYRFTRPEVTKEVSGPSVSHTHMCSCGRHSANISTARVAFSPSFGKVFAPWDWHEGYMIVLSSAQVKPEGTMSSSTR